MNVRTIGIVGGGQLGRMLTLAAKPLGFEVVVLDPSENCPAVQVGAAHIKGSLYDEAALKSLAQSVDVITIEIEHLNAAALAAIEASGTPVHPSPATIELIQDKYQQKVRLQEHGIALAEFTRIIDEASALTALEQFGGSMILKTRHGAYDGRGNAKVTNEDELRGALKQFEGNALYAEKLVPFSRELAVMVARDINGNISIYPVTETIHERNICIETLTPAQVDTAVFAAAEKLARDVAGLLSGAGVFGIEMFLTEDGEVLVNEIAPRVHNSGHYTMNACVTSQFEQHVRAVAGLPLGNTALLTPAAVMHNILGEQNGDTVVTGLEKALALPHVSIHLYGKSPTKVDRKMGHINATGTSLDEARANAQKAREEVSL